ncbi:unnamed protein product [Aphanomyces euteiches]
MACKRGNDIVVGVTDSGLYMDHDQFDQPGPRQYDTINSTARKPSVAERVVMARTSLASLLAARTAVNILTLALPLEPRLPSWTLEPK